MVLLSFQYLWLAKPSLEWYTYNSSRWVARASQTFSKQYRCSGWIETLFQVPLIALLLELRSVFTFPFWFGHAVVNPGESLFLLTTLLAPLKKRSFDKLFRLLFFPLYLLTEEERMLLPLLWFMACFSESKENWTGKLKLEGKAKWDDAKWSDATWTVRSDEAMRLERRRHEAMRRRLDPLEGEVYFIR